jgi:hypothetical protein
MLADQGSPTLRVINAAADWAVQQLKKMGVENAHTEAWGDFGKSWELQKVYVAMTAPILQAYHSISKSMDQRH